MRPFQPRVWTVDGTHWKVHLYRRLVLPEGNGTILGRNGTITDKKLSFNHVI